MSDLYNEIFSNFKLYCPGFAEDAISWEPSGKLSIIATLSDGRRVEFTQPSHRYRFLVEYDGTEESWRKEFSGRLIKLLDENGISAHYKLAETSGVSKQALSNYIHGKAIPSAYTIDKLSRALGCPIEYLTKF